MGEPSSARTLPREGALFRIASPDLRLLRCRRESPHTALLEVINASDRPVSSEMFCGGEEWKAAWLCTADGEAKTSVPLAAGTLPVSLQPRQTAVLRLDGT